MATPAFAGNAVLQFKREAVWGTDLPATKRMPCTVLDFQVEANKIRSKSMDGSRIIPAIFANTVMAKVVIEVELQYVNAGNITDPNGWLMLMDACFGADTFGAEGFATAGTPTYTHTFSQSHAIHNSLLLELVDGNPGAVAAPGVCAQLTGAKVLSWELNVGLGDEGIARLRMTLLGKAMTTSVAPTGSLTTQTFDPVLGSQAIILDFTSGETTVWQSWKLSVDNGLLEEGQLETTNLREPVLSRFAKVEWELTGDFDSYTALNAYLNHTASNQLAGIRFVKSGTAEWKFTCTSGGAYPVGHTHQVSGEGIVRQTLRYESVKDVNNTGVILDIITTVPASEG